MFVKVVLMAALAAIPALAVAKPQPAATSQQVLFSQLAQQCGKDVHPDTLQAVARVESRFNPYAIGVVKGALSRQPRNMAEAVEAAERLHAQGRNFSMGLMQVNRYNLKSYGLDYRTVFDPCANVRTGAAILADCFKRAGGNGQTDLQKAFSCYYSGNFRTGFRADFKGQPPYVVKILNAARQNHAGQMLAYSVPAVNPSAAANLTAKAGQSAQGIVKASDSAKLSPPPRNSGDIARSSENSTYLMGNANAPATLSVSEPAANTPAAPPAELWDVFREF